MREKLHIVEVNGNLPEKERKTAAKYHVTVQRAKVKTEAKTSERKIDLELWIQTIVEILKLECRPTVGGTMIGGQ